MSYVFISHSKAKLPNRSARLKIWSVLRRLAAHEAAWSDRRLCGISVLCCDAPDDYRDKLIEELEKEGLTITLTDTAEQGIRQLRTQEIDLVICADEGRIELMRLLHACRETSALRQVPIIVLSETANAQRVTELLKSGADHCYSRTFEFIAAVVLSAVRWAQRLLKSRAITRSECLEPTNAARAWQLDVSALPALQANWVAKLEEALLQHLTEPAFTASKLAGALGMSKRDLERKCQDIVGLPPSRLLRTARLAQAQLMLADGHSVKTAKAAVGFADHGEFSKQFEMLFGLSPSAFRRRAALCRAASN